ncbi:MAG: hypothetical protein P8182_09805 [Deltaproteobacteria bacterium]
MYLRRLAKSPDRLAMEIKGKDPDEGYRHLLRYGLEEAEAREVVTLFRGRKAVYGDVSRIAEAIEDALRAIRYDRARVREILSGAWQYWQRPEKKKEKTEGMKMAVQELLLACQRAVMLCRAFGAPEGETDDLQAVIDTYCKVKKEKSNVHIDIR